MDRVVESKVPREMRLWKGKEPVHWVLSKGLMMRRWFGSRC